MRCANGEHCKLCKFAHARLRHCVACTLLFHPATPHMHCSRYCVHATQCLSALTSSVSLIRVSLRNAFSLTLTHTYDPLAHDEMRLIEYRCVAPAHARPRDDMRGLYAPGGGLARLSRVTVFRRSDADEKEAERRSGRA